MSFGLEEIIYILAVLLTGVTLLLVLLLLIEAVASFLPQHREKLPGAKISSCAILVPAHNEELIIEETVRKLLSQLSAEDRLIVIADNCTDRTAAIAEKAGAEVICRDEPEFRGKGYALDFGVRHLLVAPPDVIIVVDADCSIDAKSILTLKSQAVARCRPVQARYDLEIRSTETTGYLSIASIAWTVKNYVRPLGLKRLGLPCQLMGSGMAFPWSVIASAKLKNGNIVEDLSLGLELAEKNKSAIFLPGARVVSGFPENDEGQKTQRNRWERGHLSVIAKEVPVLLWRSIGNRNIQLLALALDASVPPISFLLLLIVLSFVPGLLIVITIGGLVPLGLAILSGGFFTFSIFLSVLRIGRANLFLKLFRQIPEYALSKLSLYGNAFAGKPIHWMRSKRD